MNLSYFIFIIIIIFSPFILNVNCFQIINGTLNEEVKVNVSKSNEIIIIYTFNETMDDNKYLRSIMSASIIYGKSILIILKDGSYQVNHLKLSNYNNVTNVVAERTICPMLTVLSENLSYRRHFQVDISTDSVFSQEVIIKILVLDDFVLKLNHPRNLSINSLSPKFLMFKFKDVVEQVTVKVKSSDKACMTLSVQKAECPVYDLVENVKFRGTYQSVTTMGSILIMKKSSAKQRFFIVFVMNSNEFECTRHWNNIYERGQTNLNEKHISVVINEVLSKKEYIFPVFGMIAFYLAFFIIAWVLSVIYNQCYRKKSGFLGEEVCITNSPMVDPSHYPTVEEIADMATLHNRYNALDSENSSTTSRVKTLISVDDIFDSVSDVSNDPYVYRLNTSIYVSDLSRKPAAILDRKYFLYLWYLVIISVFYALPVVQLVVTYQQVVRTTGNEDVCYYNFKCTRPFSIFTAFNNIISNIGYVLLGILFTLITWRRHRLYNECKLRLIKQDMYKGIPQYNGLFYAVGVALTMEGILSACYHICPSNNNFQFDTAYMYILSCLCMIKIYQIRHPDVNASAHSFFMTMSFLIFVGVIGVVYNNLLFWVFFTIFYLTVSVLLTLEVYYMGCWGLDTGLPRRVYNIIINDRWKAVMPTYKKRMIVLLIFNIINLSFALFGGVAKPKDFASFFLAIFMLNLFLYFCFYIVMKMKHCEHFHVLPIIYVVIAILCWAFAIYCFIHHPTDWQKTPAGSRELNQDCIFLNFYDLHDVWHFLSAMSMFFSFLALQNLDDSLFPVDRDKIPVF